MDSIALSGIISIGRVADGIIVAVGISVYPGRVIPRPSCATNNVSPNTVDTPEESTIVVAGRTVRPETVGANQP